MAKLKLENLVFVFGSNEAGVHGAGAAKFAEKNRGMPFGKSYGHYGNAFAIPTKDEYIQTLPLERIQDYVTGFLAYARGHRKAKFQVTRLGCGLAGLQDEVIAPMFDFAPGNCLFDLHWQHLLPEGHKFWGTF